MNIPTDPNGLLLRLPELAILDLVGDDAAAILHNLTTNQIKTLEVQADTNPGLGAETFITNVKGKCVGHVLAFRTSTGFRLIGAGPVKGSVVMTSQSEAIAAHADRYTIREDAVPTIMDDQYQPWLMVGVEEPTVASELSRRSVFVEGVEVNSYVVPWARSTSGQLARLLLVPTDTSLSTDTILAAFSDAGVINNSDNVTSMNEDSSGEIFHAMRIAAGFPWYGTDLNDSHLPQEVGRERQTISFTKGCYLGQETVARLDALGQVQKLLVAWSLDLPPDTSLPQADTKLFAGGDKPVGRLTSITRFDQSLHGLLLPAPSSPPREPVVATLALGYARRSHFEAGAKATGVVGETEFTAAVVSPTVNQGV